MGTITFGWLALSVLSPDWLWRKLEECDVCQALRWSRRAWGWVVRVVPDFAFYTLAFALQLRKNHGKTCQGNRRALGWSVPNAIHLVDLAIAGDGLDWPAGPCRPWLSRQATGSTLVQRKYLPSCRTSGFPTSANFDSKLAVRGSDVGKQRNAQILVYLPVTYVPGGTSSEAKTLGF